MQCLKGYSFPGNIRELRNIIERANLLSDGDIIRAAHLADLCREEQNPDPPSLRGTDAIILLAEVERLYLRQALQSHQGDRKALALKLGISEGSLYRKLKTL